MATQGFDLSSATKLSDLIVPEVFADYVTNQTAQLSAVIQSGIVANDPAIQARANGGGDHINMPFFNDLSGEAEQVVENVALTVQGVSAQKDVAVKIIRGKAFGENDMQEILTGTDPMGMIANRVAAFWVREEQRTLVKTLEGVFSGPLADSHVFGTGVEAFNANAVLDAKQLLGDNAEYLTAIIMHSAKFTELQKQNLVQYLPVADINVKFPFYLGYRVVVDDSCPVTTLTGGAKAYGTYLAAAGAVGYANVNVPFPVETDRYSLAGEDILITRKGWIMHVRGVKWATSDANPSNAQLATAANWSQVYSDKQIRIVKMLTA